MKPSQAPIPKAAKQKAKKRELEIALRSDGWDRFKKAVAAAVKAGPKHRKAKEEARKGKQ